MTVKTAITPLYRPYRRKKPHDRCNLTPIAPARLPHKNNRSLHLTFSLPKIPTAPFCPPEVSGSGPVDPRAPFWKRALRFAGPGLLISIGYMDPGNWATAIEAGSRYGFSTWYSSCCWPASRHGGAMPVLATRHRHRHDLAQLCRQRYSTRSARVQWLLAEVSIIATDLAEVLAARGVPLVAGLLADLRHRADGLRHPADLGPSRQRLPSAGSHHAGAGDDDWRVLFRRTGADQTLG